MCAYIKCSVWMYSLQCGNYCFANCEDAHDVLKKAAMQLHIGAHPRGASPSILEGFREFEADLSASNLRLKFWNFIVDYVCNSTFCAFADIFILILNDGIGRTVCIIGIVQHGKVIFRIADADKNLSAELFF